MPKLARFLETCSFQGMRLFRWWIYIQLIHTSILWIKKNPLYFNTWNTYWLFFSFLKSTFCIRIFSRFMFSQFFSMCSNAQVSSHASKYACVCICASIKTKDNLTSFLIFPALWAFCWAEIFLGFLHSTQRTLLYHDNFNI